MSTTPATPTIEDSIKTALDAADTAITVTSEFDKIRADYDLTRAEVKTVNAQIRTVFFSALAASVLAIVVSGLMYFRTLSEMQTANETSLEGLVIFAENVDKLSAATNSLREHEDTIGSLIDSLTALRDITEEYASTATSGQEAIRKELADSSTETLGLIGQSTRGVLDEVKVALLETQGKLEQKLGEIAGKVDTGSAPQGQQPAKPSVTLDEINANLETIMLLQKEISAKLTVAKTTAVKKPAPAPAPVRKPQDNNPIKYP